MQFCDRAFDVKNSCIKNYVSFTSENFSYPHVSPNRNPTTSNIIDLNILPSPLPINSNKLVTDDIMVDLSKSLDSFINPKHFRGFPKAEKKSWKRKEKKKGQFMIATDTFQ